MPANIEKEPNLNTNKSVKIEKSRKSDDLIPYQLKHDYLKYLGSTSATDLTKQFGRLIDSGSGNNGAPLISREAQIDLNMIVEKRRADMIN